MGKILLLPAMAFSAMFFSQNSLTINGRTNINSFKCTNTGFRSDIPSSFSTGKLPNYSVMIKDFDCNGKVITSDFRKTLQAEQFPKMYIKFIDLKKLNNSNYIGNIEVKLMNKTKKYTVNLNNNGKELYGKQMVKFSDFGIIPPKRMRGMISVQDNLLLNFLLQNN